MRDFVRQPGVVLSGGRWAQPLTRLQDHNISFVAQAFSNDPSDTQFDCDLGVDRHIGLFFFQELRLTANATLRLRAGTDATFASTTFDTGTIAAWPIDSDPMTYRPNGEFTLTGAYPEDEYAQLGMPRYFVPQATVLARYIRFEATDTTADEALRIGVFGAAEVWSPSRNFAYGRSVATIDDSEITRVPGGSVYIARRRVRQRHSYGVNFLPADEIWRQSLGFALDKGQSEPFVVVPDPDNTRGLERQSIYGLASTAPAFTNPNFGLYSVTFQIDQL